MENTVLRNICNWINSILGINDSTLVITRTHNGLTFKLESGETTDEGKTRAICINDKYWEWNSALADNQTKILFNDAISKYQSKYKKRRVSLYRSNGKLAICNDYDSNCINITISSHTE